MRRIITRLVMTYFGVCALAMNSWASVVISGTRVIYQANAREVSIKLSNEGKQPAIIQSWIDDGDKRADASQSQMPFVITPPVARLDPGKGQTLRLVYTQDPMPQDRESVYYLNVLEIPPKPEVAPQESALQLAFRSRIKIFFRPQGLEGSANDAPERVIWSVVKDPSGNGYALKADNPTPFHVNVVRARIDAQARTPDSDGGMILPRGSHVFPIAGMSARADAPLRVTFDTVNDYGSVVPNKFSAQK